jgi:hypothetical protein
MLIGILHVALVICVFVAVEKLFGVKIDFAAGLAVVALIETHKYRTSPSLESPQP